MRSLLAACALLFAPGYACQVSAGEPAWLLIDSGDRTLTLMRGDSVRKTYTNISVGRNGVSAEKQRRDGKTPLGEFHIVRMRTNTAFHRFFTLDYPNLQHADSARRSGLIHESEYAAIRKAIRAGRLPPQDTALGGHIGIHGIGQGNVAVHEDFHWTYGCVALTNAQIDDLFRRIHIGMKVVIQR